MNEVINIHKVEVESGDPDRFAASLVAAMKRATTPPAHPNCRSTVAPPAPAVASVQALKDEARRVEGVDAVDVSEIPGAVDVYVRLVPTLARRERIRAVHNVERGCSRILPAGVALRVLEGAPGEHLALVVCPRCAQQCFAGERDRFGLFEAVAHDTLDGKPCERVE